MRFECRSSSILLNMRAGGTLTLAFDTGKDAANFRKVCSSATRRRIRPDVERFSTRTFIRNGRHWCEVTAVADYSYLSGLNT